MYDESASTQRTQDLAPVLGTPGAGLIAVVLAGEFEMIVGDERWCPAGQLLGQATQGVEVGPGADGPALTEHFRRGVPVIVRQTVEMDADSLHRQGEVPQNDPVFAAEVDVGRQALATRELLDAQRESLEEHLGIGAEKLGNLAVLLGSTAFVLNDAVVKLVSAELPSGEILVVRGVLSTCMLIVGVLAMGAWQPLRILFAPLMLLRLLSAAAATTFRIFATSAAETVYTLLAAAPPARV